MDWRGFASAVNFLGKAALLCLLHLASTESESGQKEFSTVIFIYFCIAAYRETNFALLYELTCDCLAYVENIA